MKGNNVFHHIAGQVCKDTPIHMHNLMKIDTKKMNVMLLVNFIFYVFFGIGREKRTKLLTFSEFGKAKIESLFLFSYTYIGI